MSQDNDPRTERSESGPVQPMSVKMRGTPKSLREAILNGMDESMAQTREGAVITIENHVRDYMAQKFGAVTIGLEDKVATIVINIWNQIKGSW